MLADGVKTRKKLIIDTDPGVDDAMAILAAFNSPEVEVIGLTTIYGNVPTLLATQNALRLVEMAGKQGKVTVAHGSLVSMTGNEKTRIADFVHGQDGFGNINMPSPQGKECGTAAAQYIVETINAMPGEVSILALAPLTNIAQALMLDPSIGTKWRELVILGGAFFVNGNVNPAAEANIYGDPEAADMVFGAAENIKVIGLDVTSKCLMTGRQLAALAGKGAYGTFLSNISKFYLAYHTEAYNMDAIMLHDPTALLGVLAPELFRWRRGAIRVCHEGVGKGHCIMDAGLKVWRGTNDWVERPKLEVAMEADVEAVVNMVLDRLTL